MDFMILQFSILVLTIRVVSAICSYGQVPYETGCEDCGLVYYKPIARIVGGSIAYPNSWPAQVLIVQNVQGRYPIGSSGTVSISQWYRCGGTLLNRYTVVTSAQCIMEKISYSYNGSVYTSPIFISGSDYLTLESSIDVYVGAHDIAFLSGFDTKPNWTIKISVKKIIKHPNFNSTNLLNDIALILLETAIIPVSFTQPACMPNPIYGSYPPNNVNMTAFTSGWGLLNQSDTTLPNVLYNVRLTTYPESYCSDVNVNVPKNWSSQLCAGDYLGGKDTCDGDLGGGLYVFDPNINKYIVVGIVSTGEGCGLPKKPGIYTRISYYYEWINENMATSNSRKFCTRIQSFLFVTCLAFLNLFILD